MSTCSIARKMLRPRRAASATLTAATALYAVGDLLVLPDEGVLPFQRARCLGRTFERF
jgi:hypothetical protein